MSNETKSSFEESNTVKICITVGTKDFEIHEEILRRIPYFKDLVDINGIVIPRSGALFHRVVEIALNPKIQYSDNIDALLVETAYFGLDYCVQPETKYICCMSKSCNNTDIMDNMTTFYVPISNLGKIFYLSRFPRNTDYVIATTCKGVNGEVYLTKKDASNIIGMNIK